MEKWIYDAYFKNTDFETGLNRCLVVANAEVMEMVNKKIQLVKFKEELNERLRLIESFGFISYDTSKDGEFVPYLRDVELDY